MRALFTRLLIALASTSALAAERLPEEIVSDFYTTRLARPSKGVPSGRELADFSMYMRPELVCVLGAALRYNEKFLEAHPGASLPFAEGDLYSSSFELPARFKPGHLLLAQSGASVPLQFYRDEADSQGWQDIVHLSKVRNHWKISDIEYQGGLGKQGSLYRKLQADLEKAEPVEGWSVSELEACHMDSVAPAKAKSAKTKGKTKGKSASASKAKSKSGAKSPSTAKAKAKPSSKPSTKTSSKTTNKKSKR